MPAILNLTGNHLRVVSADGCATALDVESVGCALVTYNEHDVRGVGVGLDMMAPAQRVRVVALTPEVLQVISELPVPDYGAVLILPMGMLPDAITCTTLVWGSVRVPDPANHYVLTEPCGHDAARGGTWALRGEP